MPHGVLLQQLEMPWLFKDTNTTHIHPQKETEVLLLHHLNAKSPKLIHVQITICIKEFGKCNAEVGLSLHSCANQKKSAQSNWI